MTNEQKLRSALHAICNNYAASSESVDKQLHAAVKLARETLAATAAPADRCKHGAFAGNPCLPCGAESATSQPAEQSALSDGDIGRIWHSQNRETVADALEFARAILAAKPAEPSADAKDGAVLHWLSEAALSGVDEVERAADVLHRHLSYIVPRKN